MAAKLRFKIIPITAIIAAIAAAVVYYTMQYRDELRRNPELRYKKSFSNYPKFARKIEKCEKVQIYEGLPHPRWDRKLFDQEVANAKTVVMNGWRFYADPIVISESDAATLKGLYTGKDSFIPFQGYKGCGGYHPDWCIEWSNGSEEWRVQICLGCGEMQTFDGGEELYCDMADGTRTAFKQTLNAYQKQRPTSQDGP